MELRQIYDFVKEDLARVDEKISGISNVDTPWLSRMLEHSLKSGGKRVRPVLTLLARKFYNYDLDLLLPMATSVELMHTATLVHDDAIDKSMVRRGRPTINKLYGLDQSVLFGDYLFARAGVAVTETNSVRVIALFCQTLMIISSGELDQSRNAFNLNQTREQYFKRIFGKTASLFCLSTESGAILSQAPEEAVQALREYGINLGIAFQIIDDILDFAGTEKEVGKPTGADLSQGTLTLPAMFILERYPADNPIKTIFQNSHAGDHREDIKRAQEIVRNTSILEDCHKIANDYSSKARQNLEMLPESPAKRSLADLAEFVVSRNR